MRKARINVNGIFAGILEEHENNHYTFHYNVDYQGPPASLTMPTHEKKFEFNKLPPFFEGLLPEGVMLEALLRIHKLDKNDHFGQLIKVGHDVVGNVTIEEMT